VTAVGDRERWDAEELLHSLERKELVRRERRASVAGEVEYAFRHVLVRDVAYGQIPRARRADLHLAAARWIESFAVERSEDRAEMLAHHYVSALELLRAAGRDTRDVEEPAKTALREAGHRAYALSALDAAERSYRAALELSSADDVERPRLLLAIGRVAVAAAGGRGRPELKEAIPLLLEQGDIEGAADAESLLGFLDWLTGSQSEARGHFDRAAALADALPPSRTTVSVRAARFRHLALAGERPPLEEGERILEQAKQFGTTEDVLQTWITLGLARNREGDLRGLDDLAGALEQALAANSYVAARAYLNLASFTITLGDLERGRRLHQEGLGLARRFGTFNLRWLQSECVTDDYVSGQWDEAVAAARRLLDEAAGEQHYLDVSLYWVLGVVAAARADRVSALAHAREMLALAREIGDPQAFWPCLGAHGRIALECDEHAAAEASVDELVARLGEATSMEGDITLLDGYIAAHLLGRGRDLAPMLDKASVRTPWIEAGRAMLNGEFTGAADVLTDRGAVTYAAYARLLAAERSGDASGLADAIAFFQRVGATAYLARAEALLQATA
jgi:tetratricopeptide (TPR) repeat protein